MLTDTGRQFAGSQSATLVIRGMAVDEIRPKDFFQVLWEEFRISLIVGSALAALNFVRVLLMYPGELVLSLTVSVSLMAVVVVAKTIGGILPMLAKALKADPAIMACR